jgi:hypothetical protein
MVGWYDPKVLLQSAWMLTLSNIFGRHSDPRRSRRLPVSRKVLSILPPMKSVSIS